MLILLALAFAIIAVVHLATPAAPLVDLPALFADLRGDGAGRYWWLGVLLFSTLLPTVLHLCIGAFAAFTLVSGWIGRPIASGLMLGDSPEGRLAALSLAVAAALAVWLPCFLLWHLAGLGGWFLDALLTACEWFHHFLAA